MVNRDVVVRTLAASASVVLWMNLVELAVGVAATDRVLRVEIGVPQNACKIAEFCTGPSQKVPTRAARTYGFGAHNAAKLLWRILTVSGQQRRGQL
jgi:hypothetical protein